jgi:hypothetical protein
MIKGLFNQIGEWQGDASEMVDEVMEAIRLH